MEKSFEEFRKQVQSLPRRKKIRNSWGVYDYFKYYRKIKPKGHEYVLTESQYFAIIRRINKLLGEDIALGYEVELPQRMGTIQARKRNTYVRFDKLGKIVTNRPVDWDKTLKLWYEDSKAYENKLLVYREEKEVFTIYYSRASAIYNNKGFYEFKFNKGLKGLLKQNIKAGIADAPLFTSIKMKEFYGR